MKEIEILEKLLDGYWVIVWTDYNRQKIYLTNGEEQIPVKKEVMMRIENKDFLELKQTFKTYTAGKSHVALQLKASAHWTVKNMIWKKK